MRNFFLEILCAGICLALLSPSPATAASDLIEAGLDNISTLVRPLHVGYATMSDGNKFVQCRRLQTGEMRCEAAGSLMQPSLDRALTLKRRAFLEAQGWLIDPAFGLYQRTFAADRSLAEIADAIRLVLVQGYAADPTRIETQTQWLRIWSARPVSTQRSREPEASITHRRWLRLQAGPAFTCPIRRSHGPMS